MDILSFVKTISHSSQGGNTFAVWAENFAKLFYVGIYGSVVAEKVIAPDLVYKFFAGKGNSAVFNEEEEKIILARGHIHTLAVDGDKPPCKVDGKSAVGIHLFGFGDGSAAAFKYCGNAHHKFARRKRLDDIVVYAEFKAVNFVILFAAGRKNYYRYIGKFAYFLAGGKPVKFRHHNIHYNNVEVLVTAKLKGLKSVGSFTYLIAFKFGIFFLPVVLK